jgi:hypothetical protein
MFKQCTYTWKLPATLCTPTTPRQIICSYSSDSDEQEISTTINTSPERERDGRGEVEEHTLEAWPSVVEAGEVELGL